MSKKTINYKQVIHWTKIILPIIFVVWLGSMGILGGLLFSHAKHLQQMASDPKHLNLTAITHEVHGAQQEFSILRGELAPMLWISARFAGDIGAVQPLMEVGGESLRAADEVLVALTPSLGQIELSTFTMKQVPQILGGLYRAGPALDGANGHLDAAAAAFTRIKGPLSPGVGKWVSKARQLVQLAQFGIGGAQIMPGLLGKDGARTYLILLQNSDELRPTGGFISAVGRVQISKGQLVSMTAEDSYAVDDFTKEYPDPPQPLLDYMKSEQWVLRDANWSPDFPTTALEAIHLYQVSRPEQVDGVIGLNLKGVGFLIAGLEPLDVPGLSEPVTSTNIIRILQEAWNPPEGFARSSADWWSWYLSRKKSISLIMQSAMDKLLSGNVNWKKLGLGIVDSFNQRQLMVYTVPEAAALKKLGWDGSLRSSPGDYLMVVDANVGFNKANPLISESVNYQLTLRHDGTGRVIVELNYLHKGTKTDVLCSQIISYHQNVAYTNMMQACYYDYLRLVVPQGSQLITATDHPVPGDYMVSGKASDGKALTLHDGPVNWTIFGQFFVVGYGKQLQTRLEYDLPVVVTNVGRQKRYTLYLQKQPGTDAMPVAVKITLPAQARMISSNPIPVKKSPNTFEFDILLDVDRQIEIIFTPGP